VISTTSGTSSTMRRLSSMQRRQPLPTIDNDIRQVVDELAELLRLSAGVYPTPQQRIRLKQLTARRILLARVIMQRNKEHQEVTQ